MNKQQLAAKIWASANEMRSKIEAYEYKDYILGFIFYKYLSDKLVGFARGEDFSDEDLRGLSEEDAETVEHFKSNLGYFIAYPHLFSTWIDPKSDLMSRMSAMPSPPSAVSFPRITNVSSRASSRPWKRV